jgi:hypothetical protein
MRRGSVCRSGSNLADPDHWFRHFFQLARALDARTRRHAPQIAPQSALTEDPDSSGP